jgi:cytosine/adenosine deaminase-related metal-dependent hydrolase
VDAEGRLTDAIAARVEDVDGLVTPGLVNAHTHLEFAALDTPRGQGFIPWAKAMFQAGVAAGTRQGEALQPTEIARANARAARAAGTRAVLDITNTAITPAAIAEAGMLGVVLHEHLGIDTPSHPPSGLRQTPHAPHTTHPAYIQVCAAEPGPWSIHFDEDPDEAAFLRGEGEWPGFLSRLGRDLSSFEPPGCSPAAWLDRLGVLGPRALLVHATCTGAADLDRIASSGATICLCLRSNVHITGRRPDVAGMIRRGIPLVVGTDGLTSSPDLDPVAEGAALIDAFPEVKPTFWLASMTSGGGRGLDLAVGTLAVGTKPGLLHLEIPGETPLDRLYDGTRWPRRWLDDPGALHA